MKFAPRGEYSSQYASYTTIKEHIQGKAQRTYKHGYDVAKTIEDMQVIDLTGEAPVRQISQIATADPDGNAIPGAAESKRIEQETFDMMHRERLKIHLQRSQQLEERT